MRKDFKYTKALLITLLAIATVFLVGVTPLFSISDISVSGNKYYSDSHIIEKSGLRAGQNGFSALLSKNIIKMLSLRCANAEQAVAAACPYVKSVQARYAPPRAISIEIEERGKSVIVPYFGSGLLIDGEGVVVDIVGNYRESELPVALGISIKRYEVGKTLSVEDESSVGSLLLIVNAIRQADRDGGGNLSWKVDSINVSDPRNLTLGINNGISVNLGDGTELYYRVSAAKEIMAHGVNEGEKGVIMFTNGARPVFIPDTGPAA